MHHTSRPRSTRHGRASTRRDFLVRTAGVAAGLGWGFSWLQPATFGAAEVPFVQTVLGPIPSAELGLSLSHEHVLVDFIGADKITRDRYHPEEAFAVILPHLQRAKGLGCRTLVECTPAFLGRDPQLLRKLAEATGLHLLTNTGYYGAADNKFLPPHAFTETAAQLSARWLKEWHEGIEGTGIRPGFIKIGVGGRTLSEVHRKLVVAAAQTHLASGMVVASHTGLAQLAAEQLAVLSEQGCGPESFIWVHAQNEPDLETTLRLARQGCWVSFDGFDVRHTTRYVEVVKRFHMEGLLRRLLLSHDAGWYRPGEPKGGQFRPFDALFVGLLPALKAAGIGQELINTLLVENPSRAFAIQVRPARPVVRPR